MAREVKEVLAINYIQGVPPKGKSHQWELTNHRECVHMCIVCNQQTKVIWRSNGECLGYPDLFQDYKGAPLMTVERPDLKKEIEEIEKEEATDAADLGSRQKRKGKKNA